MTKRIRLIEAPADEPQAPALNWREQLIGICRTPKGGPENLVDAEELVKSSIVIRQLKETANGEVLELDDDAHAHLLEKLEACQWHGVDERWAALLLTVRHATDIVPNGVAH